VAAAKDCVLRPGGALRFENWEHDHAVTAGIWRRRPRWVWSRRPNGHGPLPRTSRPEIASFFFERWSRPWIFPLIYLELLYSYHAMLETRPPAAHKPHAEIHTRSLRVTVLPLVIVLPDISWWYSLRLVSEYGQNLYVRSQEMDDPY
jgi:hypothetical protein